MDRIGKDTKQSNVFGEVFSEEDLASTPMEEVQAYLEALKERRRMTVMIQEMRSLQYDEDDDGGNDLYSTNVQTRQQSKTQSESGF